MADEEKAGSGGMFSSAFQGIGKVVEGALGDHAHSVSDAASQVVGSMVGGLGSAVTDLESGFEVTAVDGAEASAVDAAGLVEGARDIADAYEVSEDPQSGRGAMQNASWAAQQATQATQAATQAAQAATVETLHAAVAEEAEAVEVETHTEERQQEAAAQKKRDEEEAEAEAAADRQAAEQQQEAREQQQEAHEAEMERIEEARLEAEAEAEAEEEDEDDPYSD